MISTVCVPHSSAAVRRAGTAPRKALETMLYNYPAVQCLTSNKTNKKPSQEMEQSQRVTSTRKPHQLSNHVQNRLTNTERINATDNSKSQLTKELKD